MAKQTNFISTLTEDIAHAIARNHEDDNQITRRNLVRTVFAGIEGLVWLFKQDVRDTAQETHGLQQAERTALDDIKHFVAANGKIKERPNYLDLQTTVRMATRIAHRINQKQEISFSEKEWQKLKVAKDVRNRITHPKSSTDLELTKSDVDGTLDAYFWLFERLTDIMMSSMGTRLDYARGVRDVLEKLKVGDPAISKLYALLYRHND
jgi:hypothetical protein